VIVLDTGVASFTIRLLLDGGKIVEVCGPADITAETTDAIVNAIHRRGGPAIPAECRQIVGKIGRLPAGKAVITTGGHLEAKHVIHTVGPIYRDGSHGEAETLASCHREAICLADQHALPSIAFPAISTGAYGYPVDEAAPIALASALDALTSAKHVARCRFVLFDLSTLRAYERAAEKLQHSNITSPFRIEKATS
jgi:O-acetyl-ADP-ribose deacetylase